MTAFGATTIARARITGVHSADRALATRLAVAGMLAGADLRPAGLPPAAVLIVNRLALPLDRRLPVRPGGRLDPVWERAARAAVDDLYRSAARPLDDAVPPGCPAVLFRDEAELLACLALDISRGRAAERWWWQAYAGRWGSLTPAKIAPLLADSPRSAPAALQLLADRGVVTDVLRRISSPEARTLLRVICEAFDAPQPNLSASPVAGRHSGRPSSPVDRSTCEDGWVIAPWSRYVPSEATVNGLAPESACLLGVALTLAHSPSVAQSTAFTTAVERWWQAETDVHRDVGALEQRGTSRPAPVDSGETVVIRERQSSLAAQDSVAVLTDDAVRQSADRERPGSPKSETLLPVGEGGSLLPPDSQRAEQEQADRDGPTALDPPVEGTQASVLNLETAEWLDGVATELGGVLFLINLMQRLDLPNCFERDWQLASQIGPWGTLELLARGLLASELPTFPRVGNSDLRTDPLWSALAGIDGRRAGELPGGAIRLPAVLRVPATWAQWLNTDPVEQVVDLAQLTPLAGGLLDGVGHHLRVWLAAVLPLLRAMLSNALGEGFDPLSDLLLRRGQLYVTSSHVDLVMPLGSVAMPVRVAGLDFDPGWLPAFGRVVQFHYE